MSGKFALFSDFSREAKLLNSCVGIFAVSFFGIQSLLRVLYLLRLDFGLAYVGLYSATGALAYMTMSIPSGALGQRFGARRIMLIGGVSTIFGMAMLPLVEFVPIWARYVWPIISQAVTIGGWAMFSINQVSAMMVVTTPQTRNRAYSLNSVLRGLGTFIGTISGGLLPGLFADVLNQPLDAPEPYRLSLWVGTVLALAGLVPLVQIGPIERLAGTTLESSGGPFPRLQLALVIGYVYLSHGAWATCQAFCNAYLDTDLRLSTASIGLIMGAGQFLAILAPMLIPRLATRRSNGWTLMMTALGTAIFLLPLALLPHWTAASLGGVGVTALAAAWMPAFQVYQMELVAARWRSLAYGIVSAAMGFTFASISFGGGYLAAAWGYRSLFLLGVGMSLFGAALMWFMLKKPIVSAPSAEFRS